MVSVITQQLAAHSLPAVAEKHHQVYLKWNFSVEVIQYVEPKLRAECLQRGQKICLLG